MLENDKSDQAQNFERSIKREGVVAKDPGSNWTLQTFEQEGLRCGNDPRSG